MRELLRHARSDASVSAVLALAIVAFAAGSSSVGRAVQVGQPARWWLLGLLALVAGAAVLSDPPRPLRLPLTTVLAGTLLALAAGSTLWSANPRVTFHRAASLALLLVTAALLAHAAGGSRRRLEAILGGILAGAVAVGLLSVLAGVADRAAAGNVRYRFRGFGQQATTDAMLYTLALPVAAVAVLRARNRRERAAAAAAFLLLDVLLVLSGSRGPEIGAVLALVLVGLATPGRRLLLGGAVAATALLALVVGLVQTSAEQGKPVVVAPSRQSAASASRYPSPGILVNEVGPRSDGLRSLVRSSGRTSAWRGAIEKADLRPALGWGFGTEDRVFENHYYGYQGNLVSSSWIGFYLQLGAVGAALLVLVWLVLAAAVVRALRARDALAVSCAALVAAGFPFTFVESWIYSAGNIASLPFWVGALTLGTIVWGATPERAPLAARARRKEADAVAA